MTIDEMKQRKKELGYTNKTLAEASGVPVGTLQKIFSGQTEAPREDTIKALTKVLEPMRSKRSTYGSIYEPKGLVVREDAVTYDTKRQYTLEDYYALPDDQRVELIDGEFYDMSAPSNRHQAVAGLLHAEFLNHVRKNKGDCYPFIAPNDVQLDCDDKTMVQPDVGIICNRNQYVKSHIMGAPDFVAEVLSPSTRRKDMYLKLQKYCTAGVREYWLIDVDRRLILKYDFEGDSFPRIYHEEETIEVSIWNGACRIDLKEMWASVDFIL